MDPITIIKDAGDADEVIAAAYLATRTFKAAAEDAPNPKCAAIIRNTDTLVAEASGHSLTALSEVGRLVPRIVLFSEATVFAFVIDKMPRSPMHAAGLAAAVSTAIAHSPVEAYFIAAELWYARPDPADTRPLVERENKMEGVLLSAATKRTGHQLHLLEILRGSDDKVLALQPGLEIPNQPAFAPLFFDLFATAARLQSRQRPS